MFNPKRLGVLSFVVLIGLGSMAQNSAAQSGAQNNSTPKPQAPKVEAPTTATAADASTVTQPVDPRVYEIGVNDILRIDVWREPELTRAVQVRPDGKFSLPLIGEVQAEGLTPDRLKAQLVTALKEVMESPDVTVGVQQVNSKSYQVTGYVNAPNTFPLITPIRIYQAIILAGGFREFANMKKIRILRGNQRLTFNAKDYRDGKNPEKNFLVENGDIIEVDD